MLVLFNKNLPAHIAHFQKNSKPFQLSALTSWVQIKWSSVQRPWPMTWGWMFAVHWSFQPDSQKAIILMFHLHTVSFCSTGKETGKRPSITLCFLQLTSPERQKLKDQCDLKDGSPITCHALSCLSLPAFSPPPLWSQSSKIPLSQITDFNLIKLINRTSALVIGNFKGPNWNLCSRTISALVKHLASMQITTTSTKKQIKSNPTNYHQQQFPRVILLTIKPIYGGGINAPCLLHASGEATHKLEDQIILLHLDTPQVNSTNIEFTTPVLAQFFHRLPWTLLSCSCLLCRKLISHPSHLLAPNLFLSPLFPLPSIPFNPYPSPWLYIFPHFSIADTLLAPCIIFSTHRLINTPS